MKFLDLIVSWSLYLYFDLGLARAWYLLYQKLVEWPSRREPLERFQNISQLANWLKTHVWRRDGIFELGDAISHPEAIQYRANHDHLRRIGDCDEFAHYAAAVIQQELSQDRLWGQPKPGQSFAAWPYYRADIHEVFLLTVMWQYGGHNVCLIHYTDGMWAYMDYGVPTGFGRNIQEVVDNVRARYEPGAKPLGWVVSTPLDLKVVLISRK